MPSDEHGKSSRQTSNRLLAVVIALVAAFFLLRGAWVGFEGLRGSAVLDSRDWKLVMLFLFVGTGLSFYALRKARQGQN